MEKILSFLADNYQIFALASVVVLFALIGFISSVKKKKVETSKIDEGQPISVNEPTMPEIQMQPKEQSLEIKQTIPASEQNYAEPSLEGFESNIMNNQQHQVEENQTLVIEDNNQNNQNDSMLTIDDTNSISQTESMLVIDDKSTSQTEPMLVIEEPSLSNVEQPTVSPENVVSEVPTVENTTVINQPIENIEFTTVSPVETQINNQIPQPQIQQPQANSEQPQEPQMFVIEDLSQSSVIQPQDNNQNTIQ